MAHTISSPESIVTPDPSLDGLDLALTGMRTDTSVPADAVAIVESPNNTVIDHLNGARRSFSSQASTSERKFDSRRWTPTMLSSINWLPISSSPKMGHDSMLNPLNFTRSPASNYYPIVHAVVQSTVATTNTPLLNSSSNDPIEHRLTTNGEFDLEESTGILPSIKRQKLVARRPLELRSSNFGWRLFWLPPIARINPTGHHFADFEHESMRDAFFDLCVNCSPVMSPFLSDDFPTVEAFNHLMDLFFEHVHPSIPFVHRPTFNPDHEGRWILLLSMVSSSCWFLNDQTSDDFAESMLEFLRRVTLFYDSSNLWQKTFTNCRQAQIRLLFLLSSSGSRDEAVKVWSDRCMGELCYLVNTSICQSYPKAQYEKAGMPVDAEWIDWSEYEQTIRTAFLVWQIGFLRSIQSPDSRPPVSLDSIARIRLPCTDDMFEATSAEIWQKMEETSSRATFQEALQSLYIDKKLLPDLSDFSHILLVYGVVQRTREVHDLVRQPLSLIEPVAERRESKEIGMQQADWPASVPLFLKWRNSACDCLDILHWQANATTNMADGLEPTKVLHLHFARVSMLSPLQELLTLARLVRLPFRSIANTSSSPSEEVELKCAIQRWATNDHHKARLAAIHAGMTFWHIRRYSLNAHYEVIAVLTATLCLWALSTFSTTVTPTVHSPSETESSHQPSRYSIISIDSPVNSDLVKQFVKQGQTMHAKMSGVENLWTANGSHQVLIEGRKLLTSLNAWSGQTERAVALIDGLMAASI
ncbi:hypothetical protein LTR64_000776 [Lithohypha guttulata]|uniref:uncharacterized protein n=1 Tax=Lithohypha guttulata TaxID=1690604 RepID=UPI00315D212D